MTFILMPVILGPLYLRFRGVPKEDELYPSLFYTSIITFGALYLYIVYEFKDYIRDNYHIDFVSHIILFIIFNLLISVLMVEIYHKYAFSLFPKPLLKIIQKLISNDILQAILMEFWFYILLLFLGLAWILGGS